MISFVFRNTYIANKNILSRGRMVSLVMLLPLLLVFLSTNIVDHMVFAQPQLNSSTTNSIVDKFINEYYTLGKCDIITIVEAPND